MWQIFKERGKNFFHCTVQSTQHIDFSDFTFKYIWDYKLYLNLKNKSVYSQTIVAVMVLPFS